MPEPVHVLTLINETIATIDVMCEVEAGNLKVTVVGITLGTIPEAPYQEAPKVWKLG